LRRLRDTGATRRAHAGDVEHGANGRGDLMERPDIEGIRRRAAAWVPASVFDSHNEVIALCDWALMLEAERTAAYRNAAEPPRKRTAAWQGLPLRSPITGLPLVDENDD